MMHPEWVRQKKGFQVYACIVVLLSGWARARNVCGRRACSRQPMGTRLARSQPDHRARVSGTDVPSPRSTCTCSPPEGRPPCPRYRFCRRNRVPQRDEGPSGNTTHADLLFTLSCAPTSPSGHDAPSRVRDRGRSRNGDHELGSWRVPSGSSKDVTKRLASLLCMGPQRTDNAPLPRVYGTRLKDSRGDESPSTSRHSTRRAKDRYSSNLVADKDEEATSRTHASIGQGSGGSKVEAMPVRIDYIRTASGILQARMSITVGLMKVRGREN